MEGVPQRPPQGPPKAMAIRPKRTKYQRICHLNLPTEFAFGGFSLVDLP
jgi:hypothetical protein